MHYAIADLHGAYDRYLWMLEEIGFSDADTLYILGDVVDRGGQGGLYAAARRRAFPYFPRPGLYQHRLRLRLSANAPASPGLPAAGGYG